MPFKLFRELGYLYGLFKHGYQDTQRKKPTIIKPIEPERPIVQPVPVQQAPVIVREEKPVITVKPSICGLCHDWTPGVFGDKNMGICGRTNRVYPRDNKKCPSEELKQVQKKPRMPMRPAVQPEPVQVPAPVVVREEKPAKPEPITEDNMEEKLRALDALRAIADDEELSYEDERRQMDIIKRRGYKPMSQFDEMTSGNPSIRKRHADLIDRKALRDSTLSESENIKLIKNIWRAEAYPELAA
jgi:hypothetical protein